MHVGTDQNKHNKSVTGREKFSMSRRMWNTRRVRVLVAMDEVLCNFEKRFLDLYKERYPDAPYIELDSRNTFSVEDQYAAINEDLRVCYFQINE